jgi:hypothetical protein
MTVLLNDATWASGFRVGMHWDGFAQSKLPGYGTHQRSVKTLWQEENEQRSFSSMSEYLEEVDGRKARARAKAYQGAVQDFDWVRRRREGLRNTMRQRHLNAASLHPR